MVFNPGTKTTPERAAQLMTEVIKAELGIEVTAQAILDLFEKRWRILSDLAHAIKPIGHLEVQAEAAEVRASGQ